MSWQLGKQAHLMPLACMPLPACMLVLPYENNLCLCRHYRIPIKHLVKAGSNELAIHVRSALQVANERQARYHLPMPAVTVSGSLCPPGRLAPQMNFGCCERHAAICTKWGCCTCYAHRMCFCSCS